MRVLIAFLTALTTVMLGSAVLPVVALAAGQQPNGQINVDVDLNRGHGGGAWWTNPMWIAIGVIALVVLILLIVMATRSDRTTIVKE